MMTTMLVITRTCMMILMDKGNDEDHDDHSDGDD